MTKAPSIPAPSPADNSADLIIPVILIIKAIPGKRPPAIRGRLTAKTAKRRDDVIYGAYLSRDELAALQEKYRLYDLEDLKEIEPPPTL